MQRNLAMLRCHVASVSPIRKDYTVPAATHIATRITMRRNPASASKEVVLFGEGLELLQLRLKGKQLKPSQYITGKLSIPSAPAKVVLEIETLTKSENVGEQYFADGLVCIQRQSD